MARRGITTQGDVVKKTKDGVSYATIWEELKDVTALWNDERNKIANLLSYATTNVADAIPQTLTSDTFEAASEFGVPRSVGTEQALIAGYTFQDYNLATRFTWKFLRESTLEQVQHAWVRVLEADAKLVAGKVLQRILDPTEGANEEGHRVFGLWNGTDGLGPLPYRGVTFPTSTTCYWPTEATQIDSGDIENAVAAIIAKGYGTNPNSRIVILANPIESELIQSFRANVESRPSGPKAKHDFIPSSLAPPYLTDKTLIGQRAPAEYGGLQVQGSYGRAILIESNYLPVGYTIVAATGGPGSIENCVGFREFTDPAWRGLLLVEGNQQNFPIQEAFGHRAFGTGIRHRGAAVVLQVTASSSYTVPTIVANR